MDTKEAVSLSQRIHALIFNGLSQGIRDHGTLASASNRERIADAVYAELRDGNIEFRLGPLALLAEAADVEQGRHPRQSVNADGEL